MVPLEEIFCFIDDFCKHFEEISSKNLLGRPHRQRRRAYRLNLAEIMTILVLFQLSHYRTFKDFYLSCLKQHYHQAFPQLVSYSRFCELIPQALVPLVILLNAIPGEKTGRYFVDSSKLEVCHNLRINRHRVFAGLAKRGKTSTGWFFGFKVHLIINEKGEIMSFKLTPGNRDDRSVVEALTKSLQGWLFADRGYISKTLSQRLAQQGVELITTLRKNMQKQFLSPIKKWWLKKRGIIETTFDQLKAILHIQHTRHRSPTNAFVHITAALLAYAFKPKKPNITFAQSINKNIMLTSN